jgi:hypothetical protein
LFPDHENYTTISILSQVSATNSRYFKSTANQAAYIEMAPKKRPLSGRAKQLREAKLARLTAEAQRREEPERQQEPEEQPPREQQPAQRESWQQEEPMQQLEDPKPQQQEQWPLPPELEVRGWRPVTN